MEPDGYLLITLRGESDPEKVMFKSIKNWHSAPYGLVIDMQHRRRIIPWVNIFEVNSVKNSDEYREWYKSNSQNGNVVTFEGA